MTLTTSNKAQANGYVIYQYLIMLMLCCKPRVVYFEETFNLFDTESALN
jgi:hypothetical protein